MIKVKKGTIKADGQKFRPGDMIDGLSTKDEAVLVDEGKAEYVMVVERQVDYDPENPKSNGLQEEDDPELNPPEDPPRTLPDEEAEQTEGSAPEEAFPAFDAAEYVANTEHKSTRKSGSRK